MKTQSVAASFVSLPSGIRLRDPAAVFESATVADSNTAAGSLSRIPDGRDTNDAATDWVFTTTLTRGAANVATAP